MLQAADEIQLGCLDIPAENSLRNKVPTRILILRGKVQLIAQLEVINLPGEAHHVVRNELVGSLTAQNVRLHLMEIQHQIRAEAHPVQLLGRILPRGCDPRRVDLLKVRVSLAPEGRAPAFVQAVNAPVLFCSHCRKAASQDGQ